MPFVPAVGEFRGMPQYRQRAVAVLWCKLGHPDSHRFLLFIRAQGAAVQQQLREKAALAKGDLLFDAEILQPIAALLPIETKSFEGLSEKQKTALFHIVNDFLAAFDEG